MRRDIQMLRGVAVLSVLLYHSELVPLAGGYLGVDIFFVISGYLITKNVLSGIERRQFSFVDFYARRARRLLPAAYCTLLVTTMLAAKILTADRWTDYVHQVIGTITFTANFVLASQSGYFAASANTKPLLHTWSLSIEEQYYLLMPLLLVVVGRRWRSPVLAALTLSSLALCLILVSWQFTYWRLPEVTSQTIAFYLLPARAWELLAGSMLACLASGQISVNPRPGMKWAALALLCLICAAPLDTVHPRGDAVLAVLLTGLMIAGDGGWVGNGRAVRLLAAVGDWSYSLYLVHWPLFALARSVYLGKVPGAAKATLFVLSILLAYLQYTHIEQPFRHPGPRARRGLAWLGATSIVVAVLPFAVAAARLTGHPGAYAYMHLPNRGLGAQCVNGQGVDTPQACSTSSHPHIAVWGDSYAMHLIPGLRKVASVGGSMLQLTKFACGPIRGVASLDQTYDEAWAKECLDFNERAFELIKRDESIQTVVMSSPFDGHLAYGELQLYVDGRSVVGDRSIALEKLVGTIQSLQAQGKKVILVTPPPRPGFDIGACNERRGEGLITLGQKSCDFSLSEYQANQRGTIEGLQAVHRRTGADIVWLDPVICARGTCRTITPQGVSIYKDTGHLSIPGSEWLIPQLGIER